MSSFNVAVIDQAQKGAANGVAELDGSAKVPVAQLPASVTGAVFFLGTWNANTNSPALSNGSGGQGDYYVVAVAGTTNLDGVTDWQVGDWAISNGTIWEKLDSTSAVASVAGTTGVVTLDADDVAETVGKKWAGETGATADQTGAEIKSAYEGEADTNEFSDAEQTKLAGVATGADVTGSNTPQAHTHTDKYTIVFALADDTDAAVDTAVAPSIIAEIAGTIVNARAYSRTAPTGADLIFDINLNGTTIWSTQANRVKVVASATTGTQASFNTTAVAVGDRLDLDIDQIGSTIAGKDVVVQLTIQKNTGN